MKAIVKSLLGVAACAVLAAGCAGMNKPSNDELVQQTVLKVKEALEKKDIELLMATFSEDFEHPQVGGKEEARTLLTQGLQSGYAENGEVRIDQMKVTFAEDESTATCYPLDLASSAGAVAVELVLAKEESGWLVKTINVDGM